MNDKKLLNFRLSTFNYTILGICLAASLLFLGAGEAIIAVTIASASLVLLILYAFSKGRAATEFDRLSEFEPADEREVLILRKSSTIAIKFSWLSAVTSALALTGFFTGSLSTFGLDADLAFGLLLGSFVALLTVTGVYTISAALLSWRDRGYGWSTSNRE
jgi:hypothetical protein